MLSPEAQLVLACARPARDERIEQQIKELLRRDLNWATIHLLAYRHCQFPSLALCLEGRTPGCVPEETLEVFKQYSAGQLRQNQFLLDTLLDLHQKFTAQGIPVLPYLESTLGLAPFGRLERRPGYLIDLVIRREDRDAATELIRALRLWQAPPADFLQEIEEAGIGTVPFILGPRHSVVSLHWETAPWQRAVRLQLREAWPRNTPVAFGGRALPSLSPEDLLLHICVANTETLWVTLTGICDVAEVLHARPDLQWEDVVGRARRSGTLRMLLTGLRLAVDLLETQVPAKVWQAVQGDPNVSWMARRVKDALFDLDFETNRMPETIRFHLRAREGSADRWRYMYRYLTLPSAVDRNLWHLPKGLGFLYPLLRPFRLAGSLLRRAADRPLQRVAPRPRSISGYSPSGLEIVHRMLEMAETGPEDVVYDIGCGDGRIVIEAARRFGARGVGIDINAERIRESEENARCAGVDGRVTFRLQDALRMDLSPATVVTMYLPPSAGRRLASRLLSDLSPNSRIVCHNFAIEGWEKVEVFEDEGHPALLYMRRVGMAQSATPGLPRR